jgi:hypothetical protein
MARKLYYKIIDDGRNRVLDTQWEAVLRLQHWYNSEFVWTAGRLGFKMYAVFPNHEGSPLSADDLNRKIETRRQELTEKGYSENEMILQLQQEGLVFVQKGGYFESCLASGFTRVAANEFNAYLVCEFLLKTSIILQDATIMAYDEGEFIKSKEAQFRQGNVLIGLRNPEREMYYRRLVENNHVFAIVDSRKYDNFPGFQNNVKGFNEKPEDEREIILRDWNWLGFENNFDRDGDDVQGYDLNSKVREFRIIG